jgi:hypothetical protein
MNALWDSPYCSFSESDKRLLKLIHRSVICTSAKNVDRVQLLSKVNRLR